MTLTKAELADLLFEKVGLNKREAKDMVEAFFEEIRNALSAAMVSNFQALEISNCVISLSARAATPKRGKKSRLLRAGWSPFMPARN